MKTSQQFLEDQSEDTDDLPPDCVFAQPQGWYENRNGKLYFAKVMKKKGPKASLEDTSKEETFVLYTEIGPALYIRYMTCDNNKSSWGKLLEWKDKQQNTHKWTMTFELLTKPGNEWFSELTTNGYLTDIKNMQHLRSYLSSKEVDSFAKCVQTTGWHDKSYVFPTFVLRSSESNNDDLIVLQNSSAQSSNLFKEKGTFEEWKRLVSMSEGNSMLVFALSVAFAGLLLDKSGIESGGFNFFGASSSGKSTAMKLAASVWGGREHIKSWRTTDNSAESTAAMSNDNLLILDELGQANAKVCSEMAYMLSNGQGKSRARKDGSAKPVQTWRIIFLSSGEVTLSDKLAEAGMRPKAGQEVRLVDISADAGAGLGIFQDTKGMKASEFAKLISDITETTYGHAGKKFIQHIIESEDIEERIRNGIKKFVENACDDDADGQVKRVAQRFAIAAVAGTIATEAGILNFSTKTECWAAAHACFLKWLDARGGSGAGEDQAILKELHSFIEKHGQSRFQSLSPRTDADGNIIEQNVINRVGFRDTEGKTEDVYYVLQESWGSEVIKGFNPKHAAKVAAEAGILRKSEGDRMTTKITLPGMGRTACYKLAFSKEEN